MAVLVVSQDEVRSIDKSSAHIITHYLGTSVDIKPTDCNRGSTFEETDTGDIYRFDDISWNLSADSSAIVKGINDGVAYPIVSDPRGYLIPIDYLHAAIHDKIMYTVSHTFLSVAANGYSRIRLKAGSNALHFEINFNADLKCRIKTYSSPTITGNGTLFQPFNRVIGYGNSNQGFEVYLNPTFTGGTLRGNDFSGSQTAGGVGVSVRAGAGRSGGLESILIPNQEFIIELQNAGTDVSDIGVIINCYEKPYTA